METASGCCAGTSVRDSSCSRGSLPTKLFLRLVSGTGPRTAGFQQESNSLHKHNFILCFALVGQLCFQCFENLQSETPGEVTCKSLLLCGSQPRYCGKEERVQLAGNGELGSPSAWCVAS